MRLPFNGRVDKLATMKECIPLGVAYLGCVGEGRILASDHDERIENHRDHCLKRRIEKNDGFQSPCGL